jgi:hypothetical protein
VATIAKRWVGKIPDTIEEAIKKNVQKFKYVANQFSSLNSHIELFRVT